jgi:hypothetical protein
LWKLKTGLKSEFGPVEHEQCAAKSNQKEKEKEGGKEGHGEGERGGPAASSRRTNSKSMEGEQEYA